MLADIRTGQDNRRAAGQTATFPQGPARLQQPAETGQPDQRSDAGGEWLPELALAAILLADDLMESGGVAEEG